MVPECAKRLLLHSRRSFVDQVRMQVETASREQLISASSPAELLRTSGFLTNAVPGTDQDAGIQRLYHPTCYQTLDGMRNYLRENHYTLNCPVPMRSKMIHLFLHIASILILCLQLEVNFLSNNLNPA